MTFTYLVIIVIAFGIVGVSLIQLVGEYLFTQRIKDDQRIVENLSEHFSEAMVAFDVSEMNRISSEAALSEQSRILYLDTLCVVQLDTKSEINGTRLITSEISNVLNGAKMDFGYYHSSSFPYYWLNAVASLFSNPENMTGLYACGIYNGGTLNGVLVYISHVEEIYKNLHDIEFKILLWLFGVSIAVILINMFIVRSIMHPIIDLREGIAQMASGDLSARINVRGRNEFSELALAFNTMSERLEHLDKSRAQFVSNASHELKTPLSSMKILIQSVLCSEPLDVGMAKEFLSDANNEIDRLNSVVSDLLTLVKMDSDVNKLSCEDLDISELLQEQVHRLLPLARENGIELDYSARESMIIYGDRIKMQQVLYNLIDNAIKYTQRGGDVFCSVARSGRKVIIKVEDTGIGIPETDLPHIFDRFYRVDKARSRATGGTGLGLSIVKQTVLMHGGNITAASVPGEGTTFTIDLPLSSRKADA